MGAQTNPATPLPAGVHIEADAATIARHFPLLADLQPVRMEADGLVCAPRCAPERAAAALERCPLPRRPLDQVPGWPDPPAAFVAGWYRRSPAHAPAPAGVRELIQTAGEGFGPADHPTTAMCLELLEHMPTGPGLDIGCGSGLLTQAWIRSGRGPVHAIDLDARALDQAARSLEAAGLAAMARLERRALEQLTDADITGRVIFANIPIAAHRALAARLAAAAPGAVLSGVRPEHLSEAVAPYRQRGMRIVRALRRRRFCAVALRS